MDQDSILGSDRDVLPIALSARQQSKTGIFAAPENAPEAAVVSGLQVIPIQNLREAVSFLEGETKISPTHVDVEKIFEQHDDEEITSPRLKSRKPTMTFRHSTRCSQRTESFLLESEPNTSILPSFDLHVIGHYFPEYERKIQARLQRTH